MSTLTLALKKTSQTVSKKQNKKLCWDYKLPKLNSSLTALQT